MKDILTFYQCDTKVLEEKILPRDMVDGTELSGYLERFGKHLDTLRFEHVAIGDICQALEAVFGAPFHWLLGQGERRLDPGGPVTYCSRHVPSELGEFVDAIGKIQRWKRNSAGLSAQDAQRFQHWKQLEQQLNLETGADPWAMEQLRRMLEKLKGLTPEVISVYERW
jgi:hypothetical protein